MPSGWLHCEVQFTAYNNMRNVTDYRITAYGHYISDMRGMRYLSPADIGSFPSINPAMLTRTKMAMLRRIGYDCYV